jgi:Protein of unknown function (DUF2586)
MSVPSVSITELDGQLGTLPVGTRCLVVIGDTSTGTVNTPAAYARTKDVVNAFTSGAAVVLANRFIQLYNKPVIIIKTAATTVATSTAVVANNAGTSVLSAGADTTADDSYEPYIVFVTGGTQGVAGITYQTSLDGGRTLGPVTALGVATSIVIPNSGGIGIAIGAGTVIAGATATWRTTGPAPNSADLTAALTALANYTGNWDVACFANPIDGSLFDTIETGFAAAALTSKCYIASFRIPTIAESEATYKTAFDTAFGSKATTRGGVCAGSCESVDPISGRQYLRPISFEVGPRIASQSEEIDAANTDEPLVGVNITDVNGNPKYHDERLNPGLDDSRAITLRTFLELQGVYINNPRLLSAAGSDFEFVQHRRIMNIARLALINYFTRRLSKPVLVNATTGYILEEEARDIEAGANALLSATLLTKPKASDAFLTLNRTDNIISLKTLRATAFIVPLAYPKAITIDLGFRNPLLQQVNT